MKKPLTIAGCMLLAFLWMIANSAAQPMTWGSSGGWGPDGQYTKLFDKNTVVTITGQVVSVDLVTPTSTVTRGVRLMVVTPKEQVSVMLGPSWYVENQDARIEPKDKVEVTGSRIVLGGMPMIIATEVVKEDDVMKLRHPDGRPLWSAWSKRQKQR